LFYRLLFFRQNWKIQTKESQHSKQKTKRKGGRKGTDANGKEGSEKSKSGFENGAENQTKKHVGLIERNKEQKIV
jgi:hypothetical protein